MVTAVNPCGFALLPTYLGLYLGAGEGSETGRRFGHRALRALHVGLTVTASFVLLFGLVGLAIGVTASALVRYLPWVGLMVGVLMVLVGGVMIAGSTVYTSLGERLADRLARPAIGPSSRTYFVYGLAYGTASLSCTLPIFLTVVGSALTVRGFAVAALDFVLYALGMGLVIGAFTVSLAFVKHSALAGARTLSRYVQPASATLMLLGGAYVTYYWLTLGGLLTA